MRALIATALVLVLSGCDLFTGSNAVIVRGTVTNTSSGEPLAGVGVALEAGGSAGSASTTLDSNSTDAAGSFELEIEEDACPQVLSGFGFSITPPAGTVYRYDEAFARPSVRCTAGTQEIDVRLRPDQ